MQICVYFDEQKEIIIDISPRQLDPLTRSKLEELWQQHIPRKILMCLSDGFKRLPDIQKRIGHSSSTLHEAVAKLVDSGFVTLRMSYEGNKHKILESNVVCVTKNPRHKIALQNFFKGLWVDSEKTARILKAMNYDTSKWWSAEELSLKTKIPVDEIALLLSNFDSQTTRSFSSFLKEVPFEKKVQYRYK